MEHEVITIKKEEYERLKRFREVDQELLQDIARGIKDVLEGKIRKV